MGNVEQRMGMGNREWGMEYEQLLPYQRGMMLTRDESLYGQCLV